MSFNTHMMCTHRHTHYCWWHCDSPAILTQSSLILCLVMLTFPTVHQWRGKWIREEEGEEVCWEDGRMKGGDERQAGNAKVMEDESGGGEAKCKKSGDERVWRERDARNREWKRERRECGERRGEEEEEEDLKGETVWAMNKVNRRQLRDKKKKKKKQTK